MGALLLAFTLAACLLAPILPAAGGQGAPRGGWWSRASDLASGCALSGAPQIAFPSEGPSLPSGPGAIAWLSDPAACGGRAARGRASVAIAALSRSERAGAPLARSLPGASTGPLAAVGTSHGRIAVAAGTLTSSARAAAAVLQGRAGEVRAPALIAAGRSPSLTRAYLSDSALATVQRSAIAVRVERHFSSSFSPARLIPIGPGRVTSLVATMDFRSDVLVAWQQDGAIYAHMLRASGRADPTQRVGPSEPYPQLQALVSDNDHGMVAWATSRAHGTGAASTRIYVDLSAAEVRFGVPRLVDSFGDPQWIGTRAGSLRLVRLSTENVMLAWTDFERGHYVVRASAAVHAGERPSTLLSDPARQTVLEDLATGPAAEALALWSCTPAGARAGGARTQLWTRRAYLTDHDNVAARPAEPIASPGAGSEASVAVDPANDRALAAWLTPAPGRIQYVVSRGAAGYRPHPFPGEVLGRSSGVHWLRITLAAVLALLLGAGALVLRRRARRQPAAR